MSAQSIIKALNIFCDSPNSTDEELFFALVGAGIHRDYAARLVEFLPIACCRRLLSKSGAQFSDRFVRRTPQGGIAADRPLISEPVWVEVEQFVATQSAVQLPKTKLLAIAGRSAEFDAINHLLNDGGDVAGLVLAPILLNWPDEGPALQDP